MGRDDKDASQKEKHKKDKDHKKDKKKRHKEKDREKSRRSHSPSEHDAARHAREPETEEQPATTQDGGEVSMSIEETNKLREKLGLPPLSNEVRDKRAAKRREEAAARDEETKQAKAEELKERINTARERRKQAEDLATTRGLGEADADEDDVAAWVERTRLQREADARQQKQRRSSAADARRRHRHEEDDEDDDEDDDRGERYSAAALAGAKVKHSVDDIDAGETVILTLADAPVLDERGNVIDADDIVLENALKAEDAARQKARKAAGKQAKPLFEEDGKRRSLLDKYDEEEEEALQLDDEGGFSIEERAALSKALQEQAGKILMNAASSMKPSTSSEYFSKEEMAAFKPRKKERKKLRKKGGDAAMDLDIAALEAEAAQRAAADGTADHGSRAQRAARATGKAAAEAADLASAQERYTRALETANYRSLALRNETNASTSLTAAPMATDSLVIGEDEEELYASISRARRDAQNAAAPSVESIAEQIIARREKEGDLPSTTAGADGGFLEFSETDEFTRSIMVPDGGTMKQEGDDAMEVDVKTEDVKPPAPVSEATAAGGNWVAPEEATAAAEAAAQPAAAADAGPRRRRYRDRKRDADDEAANGDDVAAGTAIRSDKEDHKQDDEDNDDAFLNQTTVGKGLAGTLGLLRDTGGLRDTIVWSGRTNDMKPVKLQGLEEVYKGGQTDDVLERDIEAALTVRDEYGRVLTPKERFRELSYRFHGKAPSKSKQEKYLRKVNHDLASKRAATSANPSVLLDQAKEVQAKTGSAFVVLNGRVSDLQQAGQRELTSDPLMSAMTSATPVLGGGHTPLVGDRKVEKMLGIHKNNKRPGGASMPPPPSKTPRT